MKKILLICGLSNYIIYFRMGLIEELKKRGLSVAVIAFDDACAEEIRMAGVDFYSLKDDNRNINPFKILSLKRRYKKLIKEIAPDIVFTFMLKPNIFGTVAAKSAGISNIYSMVEGAGDVFANESLKWRVIRAFVCSFYKRAFKTCKKVFFLNEDDRAEFVKRKLVKDEKSIIVKGIGVNLQKFEQKNMINKNKFLMIARMLKTKGVIEYCECARLVKKQYPDATFDYLGGEGTIKIADVQEYIDDKSICYLGTTKDVRPYLEECTAFILPSYREGLPMSTMEAEAVGRAIITCNTVGCKETVLDGYNGFLVQKGNVNELAEKVIYLIENPVVAEEMGKNSRTYAEQNFDQEKINSFVCKEIGLDK